MAIVDRPAGRGGTVPHDDLPPPRDPSRLHRIGEVRREQGVSLRSAARHLGTDVRSVREQEEADSDLQLSEVYAWQRVLDVPLEDLLVEPSAPLSRPIQDRARMVRLMKTAVTMLEKSTSPAMQRMAENLVEQLIELMPELSDVGSWHSVGQRRSLDELGRVAERRISEDVFHTNTWCD